MMDANTAAEEKMLSKSPEEVAETLQRMVINHLKRVYVEQSNPSARQILADYDLKYTLELVCDFLHPVLASKIKEILAFHEYLGKLSVDRYYIQHLSDTHKCVREREVDDYVPRPNDRLVRDDFSTQSEAIAYVRGMNELQRSLDLEYGRWTKHAAAQTEKSEV